MHSVIAADEDYVSAETVLLFLEDSPENHTVCRSLFIFADGVLEDLEVFSVHINASDPAVILLQSSATVVIFDSNCKHLQ